MADYRKFTEYIDHIPGDYRCEKTGWTVMPRNWEKGDADFCYSFVVHAIFMLQLNRDKYLYNVNSLQHSRRCVIINDTPLPNLYPNKKCVLISDDSDILGELFFINEKVKNNIDKLKSKDIIKLCTYVECENEKYDKCTEYVIIETIDINLVINSQPLWEVTLYYRSIPFACVFEEKEQIDIDTMATSMYSSKKSCIQLVKNDLQEISEENMLDKILEINKKLKEQNIDYEVISKLYSTKLIQCVDKKRNMVNMGNP
jgi:gamma-glutamylcyclotransferase (GGCT)/AIG2-like uncharacterized protein YtfP